MTRQHPAFGILLMVGGCLVLTVSDAISKILTDRISVAEIVFGRAVFSVLLLAMLAPAIGPRRVFVLDDWKGQAVRALLTVLSSFIFLYGLSQLPLSTNVTIGFVAPLYVTALAPLLLGEKVGLHRWSAVLVGFAGVAIVTWPTDGVFSYAVFLPLTSALCGALRDITTRWMSARSTSESMLFYSMLGLMLGGGVVAGGDLSGISMENWLLLAASALCYLAALYLQIEALRMTEAAVVAPFKYSNLIWVTILELLIWRHVPGWNVFTGAAIIIAAMLYIYHRERVRARPDAAASGAPPQR